MYKSGNEVLQNCEMNIILKMVKLIRAQGECLGVRSR